MKRATLAALLVLLSGCDGVTTTLVDSSGVDGFSRDGGERDGSRRDTRSNDGSIDDTGAVPQDASSDIQAVDVPRRPPGNDRWLFVGDSISVAAITDEIAEMVTAASPERTPIIENVAIGGTSSDSWIDSNPEEGDINAVLAASDAQFVVVALGTNDFPPTFREKYGRLVEIVIAAGRTPVLPFIPWTNDWTPGHGELINSSVAEVLEAHPEAIRGADLFELTVDRPDLFEGPRDVHPNEIGRALIREAWADLIVTITP